MPRRAEADRTDAMVVEAGEEIGLAKAVVVLANGVKEDGDDDDADAEEWHNTTAAEIADKGKDADRRKIMIT